MNLLDTKETANTHDGNVQNYQSNCSTNNELTFYA